MDLDNSDVCLHQVLTSFSIIMGKIPEQRSKLDSHPSKNRSGFASSRRDGNRDKTSFPSAHSVLDTVLGHSRTFPSYNPQNQSCKHLLKIFKCCKLETEGGRKRNRLFYFLPSEVQYFNFQPYVFCFNHAYNQVWFVLSPILYMRKPTLNNIR